MRAYCKEKVVNKHVASECELGRRKLYEGLTQLHTGVQLITNRCFRPPNVVYDGRYQPILYKLARRFR
jgi:hypothetical protein